MQNTLKNCQSVLINRRKNFDENNELVELNRRMVVQDRKAVRYRFSKALVIFVLATVSILFGSVQAWVWSFYSAVIYVAFVVFLWQQRPIGSLVRFNGYGVAVGLFLVLTLFACLPLSEQLMRVLNPVRYKLLMQSKALTALDAAWPTLSYAPFHSLSWWAFLLGLGLLFELLKIFFKSIRMLRLSLWILLVLAVAQGLYGLFQALIPTLGVLWENDLTKYLGDARGTWINRNHFAGFMGMMLPLLLGVYLSRMRWSTRLKYKTLLQSSWFHQHSLFLLALVIIALAILFSKSRAGIMSVLFGLGTFWFMIKGKDKVMPKRLLYIVGLFFGLISLYGLCIGLDPIIERFLALSQNTSRLDYWKDSLSIIADHPLGIGLATFKYVFPVYSVTSLAEAVTPYYLHNDVLQLLVEAGWPGFILLVGAYLSFMGDRFRRIKRMVFYKNPQSFFIAVGAFSGLMSISFHSFFDFNLQIPANMVYFVVLLAMLKNSAES